MRTSTYTTTVLEPSEGFSLTQSADVPEDVRVYSKRVYLAVNASPDDWREIPDGEVPQQKVD